MAQVKQFDVAVLGDGPAGDNLARALGKAGKRVLVVEEERLGGECLNAGCIPSKALIHLIRDRSDRPWSETKRDVEALVAEIRGGEADGGLAADGVELRRGTGAFDGPQLLVDGQPVAANAVVIATGTSPAIPPIPGLVEARPLTNRDFFAMKALPARLAVIGGGPIGLELGQATALAGAHVTIFETGEIASTEDAEVSAAVVRFLSATGIEIQDRAKIKQVAREGHCIVISVGRKALRFDEVLVAAGRVPELPRGAPEAGLKLDDDGFIAISACGRTNLPRVWAIGDVAGGPAFTHHATYQAHHLARHFLTGRCPGRPRELVVPWAIFTTPEIGHAGLTEEQATKKHGPVRVATLDARRMDWFRLARRPEGFAKVVCDAKTGQLLGAHFFCAQASTLAGEAALAIQMRLTARQVADCIHPYPTPSELFRWACAAAAG